MSIAAVMPTFNQAEFLVEAVESLQDQCTLVVVDDGSTDDTPRLLNQWQGVVSLSHAGVNHGTAAAINTGIDFIRKNGCTEWLSWVSSDNVHHPNWASKLLAKTAPDVGVVYSGFNRVTMDDGCKHEYRFRPWAAGALMRPPCFIGPSFIVRAEVWQPHRGKCSHDLDNWLRVEEECLARALRIVGLDEPLCFYRVHKKMATLNKMPGAHDAAHWRKEAARRRSHHQHSRRRR